MTVNSAKKLNTVYIEPATDNLIGVTASSLDKQEESDENMGEIQGK